MYSRALLLTSTRASPAGALVELQTTASALAHYSRFQTADVALLLHLRACASKLLADLAGDTKAFQCGYRFLFAVDDELGSDRVVSLRALSSGIRHGSHTVIALTPSEPLPKLDETGPIVAVCGPTPDHMTEVRDAVARLRAQHPSRQIVSYLGGQSEIGVLGAQVPKFAVDL